MSADQDYARELVGAVLAKAARAREDASAFFSFVMREETTREVITAAAHQRLFFDFVEAHPRCVVRMPPGFSKTMCTASLTLRKLGTDPTARGAVIASTEGQASKPLQLVRDMIANRDNAFPELRLVYPDLVPGDPEKDPWTQTKITIKRPAGIRDASLSAYGTDSRRITGSRLNWILVDDILDEVNTATRESCRALIRWFFQTIVTRIDIGRSDAHLIVTNTPWSEHDLTYELQRQGWPTLEMNAEGRVLIFNAKDFDSAEIRPSYYDPDPHAHRLRAHDAESYGAPLAKDPDTGLHRPYDLRDEIELWPEVADHSKLAEIRRTTIPSAYAKNYQMKLWNEADSQVQFAWVEKCKALARAIGHFAPVTHYQGSNPVAIGMDLAFGEDPKKNGKSALFAFELLPRTPLERPVDLPDGTRVTFLPAGTKRILAACSGTWPTAKEKADNAIQFWRMFGGILRVETNAAQKLLLEWIQQTDASVPVKAHNTGKNKRHVLYGVESVFTSMQNGAWLIPNAADGSVDEGIAAWLEDCYAYRPTQHTGDLLMASWFASEQGRLYDVSDERERMMSGHGYAPSISAMIGAR